MTLEAGATLDNGRFRIVRAIGRGGYGYVYEAVDNLLGDPVAIKELIPGLVGDAAMLRRFLAEAKATMRLTHERIVRTHHVFPSGGNYYIVMEYMELGSLEERLRAGGPLPIDDAVRVAAAVCEGLSYAHQRGVVHCDLKPANVLFSAPTGSRALSGAKVADFGIAHVSEDILTRSWQTPAGFVAGTLPYMSPEQADGVRDDPRIDIFALGAVLYRMLTGQTYLRFDRRETPRAHSENVQRIYHEQPVPPSAYRPGVPGWLDRVVLVALAKRPEHRFANAEAMRAALLGRGEGAIAATAPPQARVTPAGPPPRAAASAKQSRRAPVSPWAWVLLGAVAVLLVSLAIATALLLGGGNEGEATGQAGAVPTRTAALPLPGESRGPSEGPAATDSSQDPGVTPVPTLVLPTLTRIEPQEAEPGQEVTVTGHGGYLFYPPATYDESARDFPLYLDGEPVGMIACYASGCQGSLALATTMAPGDHEVSVEGGSRMTLKVVGPGAGAATPSATGPSPTATRMPTQTHTPAPVAPPSPTDIPSPPAPVPVGGGGRLAYTSSHEGRSDIYVRSAAAGSRPQRVTNTPEEDWHPAWSPDGSRIVFQCAVAGVFNVCVVNADGSGYAQITSWTGGEASAQRPVWSPDGGRIAVSREPAGAGVSGIWVMDSDGGNQRQVTEGRDPSWSPRGEKIAFIRSDGQGMQIWTARPDGTGEQQLTQGNHTHMYPTYSPGGERIAFEYDREVVAIMDAAGGPPQIVVELPTWNLSWSPDGQMLAVSRAGQGLWLVNVDGSGLVQIATEGAQPSWGIVR